VRLAPPNYFYGTRACDDSVAEVQCPNCRAITSGDAAFCPSCGASLAAVKTAGYASPLPTPVMGTAAPSQGATPLMSGGSPPIPPTPVPFTPPPAAAAAPAPPPPGVPPGYPPPSGAMPPPVQPAPSPFLPPLPGFAPPIGGVTPQLQTARQLGKDAFVPRLLAFLVDGFMCGLAGGLIGSIWLFRGPPGWVISWWLPAVLMAVYMIVMEGSSGQTLGKMLFSVKVVREDLGPITSKQAQSRAMGILLYPLLIPVLLDLMYVSDEGQSIGDRWAHTTVIKVA